MVIPEGKSTLFDSVISPLSRESFLSQFWGKDFLHLRGTAGRFKSLLSWDELSSILEHHRFEPLRLRLFRDGKQIDSSRYLTLHNELKTGAVINHLSEGATLILDSVDAILPAIRELVEAFEEAIQTRTTVNLYAGWRTQTGLDLHWDPQDTMIIQVSGRKRWKVYPPTRLHPLDRDVESSPQPTAQPIWDCVLEDGDMLYLPRGWWHIALPLDEPSLHLTITIVPANGINLLEWSTEQLKRHPEVRMNIPHLASDADRKRYVDRLRELLMEVWSDGVVDKFLAEWEAGIPMRPRIKLPLAPTEARAPVSQETIVRLASCRRMAFVAPSENGTVSFVAGGFKGECSADLVPALKLLSGTVSHSIEDLCAQLPNQTDSSKLMILITALSMRGAVQIEPRETSGPKTLG